VPELNRRQALFVSEYLQDFNGTQAVIRAGYSRNGADVQAVRLLANARIASEIARRKAAWFAKNELSSPRVLEEMRRVAFSDARQFFDKDGNLLPISQLSDDAAAAIASFEILKRNLTAGDDKVDVLHKIRTCDKNRALENLAKHFGLLIERTMQDTHLTIEVRVPWMTEP